MKNFLKNPEILIKNQSLISECTCIKVKTVKLAMKFKTIDKKINWINY